VIWKVIVGVLTIVVLILKNKFEKNADVKKTKADLQKEAKEAVALLDLSRINAVIGKLRR